MQSQLTLLILAAAGAGIPLAVAVLTKAQANPWLKSVASVALAGVTAIGAHLADVKDVNGLKGVLLAGLLASIAAGGTLASTWAQTATNWLHDRTDEVFGLG